MKLKPLTIFIVGLLLSSLIVPFYVTQVTAEIGIVVINEDGSIEGGYLSTVDNVTYTVDQDFQGVIGINAPNVILDGCGHTIHQVLTGAPAPKLQDHGGIGVYITASNVTVTNLKIDNIETGIYVEYANDCNITGNTLTNILAVGVEVYSSNRTTVNDNDIHIKNNNFDSSNLKGASYFGINLMGSQDCVIIDNIIRGGEIGISIQSNSDEDTNNEVTGNNIIGADMGIRVHSYGNTFTKNIANATNDGLGLYDGNNIFIENTLISSVPDSAPFYLSSGSNNTFYHNNFMAPQYGQQYGLGDAEDNIWDNGYPSGGNYWSKGTHVDQCSGENQDVPGSDGIVDEPFELTENMKSANDFSLSYVPHEKDNYPLAHPYGWNILNVTIIGNGTISALSGANLAYPHEVITVSALSGVFDKWVLDGQTVKGNTISVTTDTDRNLTAIFASPLYILPTQNADWPTYMHNSTHSGSADSSGPLTNQTLWQFKTRDSIETSPAIVDNVVYVSSTDRSIYAINVTTNEKIWNYKTDSTTMSSPAVVNGIVYVSFNCYVYALNATTNDANGELLWGYPCGESNVVDLAFDNGVVYVAEGQSTLALNATTANPNGELIWNYTDASIGTPSKMTVGNGKVYVTAGANISVLNANPATSDGECLWVYTTTGYSLHDIVVSGDLLIVGSSSGNITAFNAVTEEPMLWSCPIADGLLPHFAVEKGIVYASSSCGYFLVALNVSTINQAGEVIWNYSLTANLDDYASYAPIVADGVVYIGLYDYFVAAFNATTDKTEGELLWIAQSQGRMEAPPAIANGVLFASSTDGSVYAFAPNRNVLFTAEGLLDGTSWSVTFGGITQTSTLSNILFIVCPTGDFNYSITTPAGYNTEDALTGTVTLSDADYQKTITFTPQNTIIATKTTDNQTYTITVSGSIIGPQISNMTITPFAGNTTTWVEFTLTGPAGTSGTGTLTIPKEAIPYGSTPQVYIDGVLAESQSYTQDAQNYYVTYSTHFSTHQISIQFTTPTQQTSGTTTESTATPTPTPSPTPPATTSPTVEPTPSPAPSEAGNPSYIIVLVIAIVLAVLALGFVYKKRKDKSW